MKNRKLLLIVSLVLAMTMSLGGTLAYLTDTDSDVNVMVVGNVNIEQHEYERVVDEMGNPVKGFEGTDFKADYGITESYKLQEFTQGKPALPAVYGEEGMGWDEFQQLWNQVGAPGSNDLFAPNMKNVIDKFVFVENTGKSDAYYRTIIAIEAPEGLSEKTIHTSFNANSRFDYNDEKDGVQNAKDSNKFYTEINGVRYLVYVVTYTDILTPGEVSRPSLLQLYLDPMATNEDVALFGDTWEVLVVSQAVQAGGFADADTALDTAFKNVTADSHPWMDGEEGDQEPDELPIPLVVVNDAEELQAALNAAVDGVTIQFAKDIEGDVTVTQKPDVKLTINGNGNTFAGAITVDGKSNRYETAGVTIKNINFDANGISADASINLGNESNINNTRYTSNVTVSNCTFEGSASEEKVAIKSYTGGDWNVTISGCTVGEGMHSLCQFTNVEKGLKIENCKVYSKNGVNLNNTPYLAMSGCNFDTKGYAVRFGVNGNTLNGNFTIADSNLKSANDDGDAVIIFRGNVDASTLTLTNTTLSGTPDISGAGNATINK